MASPRLVVLCALFALGCDGAPGPSPEPGPRSTSAGVGGGGGFASVTSVIGSTGGGGSQGSSSLDGPLGFAPQDAFAQGTATTRVTVELTDGYQGCAEDGAYNVVRITLPTGGSATFGTVSVDAGATVEILRGVPGDLAVADTAWSGQVTLNDVGGATLGGNFSAEMMDPDGGDAGALSGIFAAAVCN